MGCVVQNLAFKAIETRFHGFEETNFEHKRHKKTKLRAWKTSSGASLQITKKRTPRSYLRGVLLTLYALFTQYSLLCTNSKDILKPRTRLCWYGLLFSKEVPVYAHSF